MKRVTKMSPMEHRINVRLAQLDMTKNTLAKKLRVTPQRLNAILHRGSSPTLALLERIAKALQTTIGYLVGEVEARPS